MEQINITTLIHTALIAEAKPIIGYFGLKCTRRRPFNIYQKEGIVLIASGVGAQKTKEALKYALELFRAQRLINIGIAGCADKDIKIGSLFCATHKDLDIPYASLCACAAPVSSAKDISSTLVDMESGAFLQSGDVEKYIFKVVSDYLEDETPSKAKVGALIQKTIPMWSRYV
ncbi:MAG: nucleoside phosphorylase [Campylobacteraceae bacterium]|jgi:nucleoside phosphorylase|nr:nucleoside phosphorylase [Campylobacteraceae bacterium]